MKRDTKRPVCALLTIGIKILISEELEKQ
jgi:hypothetical protein